MTLRDLEGVVDVPKITKIRMIREQRWPQEDWPATQEFAPAFMVFDIVDLVGGVADKNWYGLGIVRGIAFTPNAWGMFTMWDVYWSLPSHRSDEDGELWDGELWVQGGQEAERLSNHYRHQQIQGTSRGSVRCLDQVEWLPH